MKKKNVVLWMSIAFLLLSSPVYSQIKLGFHLGSNSAYTHPNSPSNLIFWTIEGSGKTKFSGGILVEFKINDMFYIQPEFNFLNKEARVDFMYRGPEIMDGVGLARYTVNYNYEIPINILAKFNVGNFTPFIFAGPSLSFLSEAKSENNIPRYDYVTDVAESFTKTDFSINFGGGVEFSILNSIDLFVMARYSLGLTNTVSKELYYGLEKINTRGLAFSTGFKFSI